MCYIFIIANEKILQYNDFVVQLVVLIFGLTKIANAKTVSVQSTSLRNPRQLMVLFPDHQTNTRNAKQFRDANCLCANSQSTRNLPSRILRPLLNKQLSDMQARTHNSEGDGLSHEQGILIAAKLFFVCRMMSTIILEQLFLIIHRAKWYGNDEAVSRW